MNNNNNNNLSGITNISANNFTADNIYANLTIENVNAFYLTGITSNIQKQKMELIYQDYKLINTLNNEMTALTATEAARRGSKCSSNNSSSNRTNSNSRINNIN